MDTNLNKEKLHLIRTNNGEWISDRYAVFMTPLELSVYQIKSKQYKLKLSIHQNQFGEKWCYKHEIEAIDVAESPFLPEFRQRKLKVNIKTRKD